MTMLVVGTLAEIRLKILSDGTVHVLFIPFRRIKAVAMNAGLSPFHD